MSLLMEALRKAEEAKRQSAQREKDVEEARVNAVAAVIPLGTEMSALSAFEAQIEDSLLEIAPVAPAATETLPEYRFELDFPEETPVAATAAQHENLGEQEYILDYPDEEALDDVAPAVEFSQAQQPETRIPDAVVRQFEDSAAADKPLHQAPVRESGLSLTLADQPPTSRQVFMPELIVDELPTPSKPEIAAPAAPVFNPPPEPVIAAADVGEPLAAVSTVTAPLRAEPTDARSSPRVALPAERSQAQRRESARAVFNAKAGSPAVRRRNLIGVVVLVALFPLVGGVYFLLQELGIFGESNQYNIPASYDPSVVPVLAVEESAAVVLDSALPDVMVVGDASGAPVEVATVEVPVEAPAETSIDTPVASPIAATPEIPAVESAALTSPVTEPASEPESPASTVNSAAVIVEVVDTPTPPQPAAPINIVRSNTPQIDPVVIQAYAAFQSRDYVDARALYQQALRATPNSRDAMLGIAAVAMLQGESTLARNMYTRLLAQDPRDALARTGLLETVPASDPVRTESELRSLFDSHPEVAPLAFALGNLYASQQRWNEAQQAYYDALRAAKAGAAGPLSPDYAFNLAVSLERLNQPQSAYEFYREALQQSAQVQPNFDPRVLRQRVEDLERSLP